MSASELPHIAVQPLRLPAARDLGAAAPSLAVARLDRLHPHYGGNKWFKLRANIAHYRELYKNQVLGKSRPPLASFGGLYSNHIPALAQAAAESGLSSIGFIRDTRDTAEYSEAQSSDLPQPLRAAIKAGMRLEFLTRSDYRRRHELMYLQDLERRHGAMHWLPEGGSNLIAVKACTDIPKALDATGAEYDVLAMACGTAGTLAGIALGLETLESPGIGIAPSDTSEPRKALGIAVLKGDKFLTADIQNWHKALAQKALHNWQLSFDYVGKGYAASSLVLDAFIAEMRELEPDIPLEPCYTAKLFYGINAMIAKGEFSAEQKLLLLHTGGVH